MVGIYSITSPTGKVYFGQTTNYRHRIATHKNAKDSSRLYNSIKKHGFCNHVFTFLHELPKDVSKETLTIYEQFYIDQYRQAGVDILNVKDAGNSGSPSQEVKDKIAKAVTGWIPSDETRKLWSIQRKGRRYRHSEETKKKMSIAQKARTHRKRRPHSQETKNKISLANKGKTYRKGFTLSVEHKAKITGRPKNINK